MIAYTKPMQKNVDLEKAVEGSVVSGIPFSWQRRLCRDDDVSKILGCDLTRDIV